MQVYTEHFVVCKIMDSNTLYVENLLDENVLWNIIIVLYPCMLSIKFYSSEERVSVFFQS